jgi:NADH dehydrogenase [ubiquinone] 1 alpha subcomplex assembly factor 7
VSPDQGIAGRLRRLIETTGPISVAQYVAEANAHYYATRDPLGAAGDFTTAPEISQMFGELVGLCLADLWLRAGRPVARYLELGPGRGTLAADALRAMRSAGLRPEVHFVETSPVLREAQAERVPDAHWHRDMATVPGDRPLLVAANEFFDALPVHQLIRTDRGWRELLVRDAGESFERVPGPARPEAAVPAPLRGAPSGTVLETSPASVGVMRQLAQLLARAGGAALMIDYGHAETAPGDTLQAVSAHGYADPWTAPGERDLTAHVDFGALAEAARGEGLRVLGPVEQGRWLKALGIDQRAAALAAAAPARTEDVTAARERLTAPEQMGRLFKVLALAAPSWPDPAGFA